MSFLAAPTFPRRFKRPVSSTFPTAPTWPPSSVLPTPPVPGPVLWLRGDDAPNSSGGLAVPLWKDVSGNGNDATQATVASQPTGISNQINGHAAVVFDGVNDFLDLQTPLAFSGGETIFSVCNPVSGSAGPLFGSASGGINYILLFFTDGNLYVSNDVGVQVSWPFSNYGSYSIFSLTSNGSSLTLYINGVSQGSRTISGLDLISRIGSSGTLFFNGKNPENLIYLSDLSDSDRQTVQAYLGTKYAIAVSLPQITQVDFTGLSGASFVTGGAGLSYLQYVGTQAQGIWFNTGTETQPDLSGIGVSNYVQISVNPLGNADGVAEDLKNGINGSGTGNWTAVHNSFTGQCQITDTVNRVDTPAIDVNTGATITVLQAGHPNE